MPTKNQIFGKKGEDMAAEFLKEKGYKIIETNFYRRVGEIDIIARDTKLDEIVFVEVKTRRSNAFGYPEEAVTKRKIAKMAKAAQSWLLNKSNGETKWRMDILSIKFKQNNSPEFYHIKNISL